MSSPTFSRLYISPWLADFFERYPDISIELLTSTTPTSLIEDGIDIAIYGGDLSDSSLIAKKIAESALITVATPQYLARHGAPERPSDLARHSGTLASPPLGDGRYREKRVGERKQTALTQILRTPKSDTTSPSQWALA
jgi:DNA-binding transcriptional LysR family regulator